MNVYCFLGDSEQPFADVPEQSEVSMPAFLPPGPSQSDSLSLSENLLIWVSIFYSKKKKKALWLTHLLYLLYLKGIQNLKQEKVYIY